MRHQLVKHLQQPPPCENNNEKSTLSAFCFLLSFASVTHASELCLEIEANNASGAPIPYFLTLSVSNLNKGHVQLTGSDCYRNQGPAPAPLIKECLPVLGSGILYEDKLEASIAGSDYMADLGVNLLTTALYHLSINLDTYTGTIAGDLEHKVLPSQGSDYQQYQTGTVKAVACPAQTPAELAEDRKFKRAINAMTRLK